MIDSEYYVYGLINPFTKVPFYVGKGKDRRVYRHLLNNKNSENKFKDAKIKGIRNKGAEPEIYYYAKNLTESEAYNFEKLIIQTYGRIKLDEDGILTNRCEDNRPPKITKQYINKVLGLDKIHRGEEWRANISLSKPNRRGIITPYGEFLSCGDFYRKIGIVGPNGLRSMLKSCDIPLSYSRQGQLKKIFKQEDIGKTPRELGWYFK